MDRIVTCPNIRTPAERRQLSERGERLRSLLAEAGPDRCELVVETEQVHPDAPEFHSLALRISHRPNVRAKVHNFRDRPDDVPRGADVVETIHANVLSILSRAGRDDGRRRLYQQRAERILAIAMHDHAITTGREPWRSDLMAEGLFTRPWIRLSMGAREVADVPLPALPAGHLTPVHRLWMYEDDAASIADDWFHSPPDPDRRRRFGDAVAMLRLTSELQMEGAMRPLRARTPP